MLEVDCAKRNKSNKCMNVDLVHWENLPQFFCGFRLEQRFRSLHVIPQLGGLFGGVVTLQNHSGADEKPL